MRHPDKIAGACLPQRRRPWSVDLAVVRLVVIFRHEVGGEDNAEITEFCS
jgi:hypothetical protein